MPPHRDHERQRSSRDCVRVESHEDGVGRRVRSSGGAAEVERHVDSVIAAIASVQQAIVTRQQLLDARVGRAAIDHWVRQGRLHVRHRGVYALGHTALPQYSDEMAAVLACQPRAILSHASAAYVWGIRPLPTDGVVDVTTVGRKARHRPGIRAHRAATLARTDLRHIQRIPITSPARTLIDIADDLESDRDLELAVHEAIARKRVTIPQLRAAMGRYPRRRGCARLNALTDPDHPLTVTDSKGAERLHYHLRRSGLPQPRVDTRIGRWWADFYWPQVQLVIELDGGDFHSTRPRIERDHRKDIELKPRGIEVLRFTGRQVTREIEFVLVAIARVYEKRSLALGHQRAIA